MLGADDRVIETKWAENPDFESKNWFERVSLHYGLARFHWDEIAVLFVAVLIFAALIAAAFHEHRHWPCQASHRGAVTANRGDASDVDLGGEREG